MRYCEFCQEITVHDDPGIIIEEGGLRTETFFCTKCQAAFERELRIEEDSYEDLLG